MKFRFLIATLLISNVSFGQSDDCECVTRSPFFSEDHFHLILSAHQARTHKVDSVLIFLIDSLGSAQLHKSFELDSDGKLTGITSYYEGRPGSKTTYIRDSGKIVREEFYYLGEDGFEERFGKDVTDYHYNQKGLLIKTQERGIREEILPQDETHHTVYEYDSLDRIHYKKNHMYWGPQGPKMRSIYETQYVYAADGTFNEIIDFNSESLLTAKHMLTPEGLPYRVIYKGAEERFNYSGKGRLLSYELSNNSTFVDECPENSNYRDSLVYDEEGLVRAIRHEYADKVCELILKYK